MSIERLLTVAQKEKDNDRYNGESIIEIKVNHLIELLETIKELENEIEKLKKRDEISPELRANIRRQQQFS